MKLKQGLLQVIERTRHLYIFFPWLTFKSLEVESRPSWSEFSGAQWSYYKTGGRTEPGSSLFFLRHPFHSLALPAHISPFPGYNTVVRIPAGATNIDIKQVSYSGKPEDDNYLGKCAALLFCSGKKCPFFRRKRPESRSRPTQKGVSLCSFGSPVVGQRHYPLTWL